MKIFENGNTYEIYMTKNEAETCYHSGPCDVDTAEMVRKHPRLVKRMRREVLIAAFREFGAWTKEELEAMSDDDLRRLALWDAAAKIQGMGRYRYDKK